jgi:anhydro-N-acetylmuramic acid kinase
MERANEGIFLGVMSGTSLDGLDLALCTFKSIANKHHAEIVKAVTIPYDLVWQKRLTEVALASAEQYFKLHHEYGKYIGECINAFLMNESVKPNYIASHGHTIFHQPQNGFTTQMGCGATIAAVTGISTVCDFRSLDVALQGQGAPLVPIGDALLFNEYEACLNLGGIANISFAKQDKRLAFDICFVNMALNFLANQIGKSYDTNGELASVGIINEHITVSLMNDAFFASSGARSLGREQFETFIQPILDLKNVSIEDQLASVVNYAVKKIAKVIHEQAIKTCLITGGGAHNSYFIQQLKNEVSQTHLTIPDKKIIDFKEALIFAFLGYLRINENINTLKTVTGARMNSVGGAVYLR